MLSYFAVGSTVALANPGATIAALLINVIPGDVLELPGATVSSVTYGANNLAVTTDAGSYDFTNVSYTTTPIGYTAAPDAATGLVAITFTAPDDFMASARATSGPFTGFYDWNNTSNWSRGIPVDGDSVDDVTNAIGITVDDLGKRTIGTLTLGPLDQILAVTDDLTVQTVIGAANSGLEAGSGSAVPVTVTVGTLAGSTGYYGADGSGDRFIDRSATDPGEYYEALNGGFTELLATPSDTSIFYFNAVPGTYAFANPAASSAALLSGVQAGDAIELPGATVSNVTYGANSLTVTTDAGTYAFTNVAYTTAPTGYTAATDAATGLVAITFTRPNVFQPNAAGSVLWSDAANFTASTPANGDSITTAASGTDDVPGLGLTALVLTGTADVKVTANSLNVTTATVGDGTTLRADATAAGAPVTVTIGTITGHGTIGADGVGGDFIDNSATNAGEAYLATNGGTIELAAIPADTATLTYAGLGTFALQTPGDATIAAALTGIGAGDVLELPGSIVTTVSFAPDSLTITTDLGTYDFGDVNFLNDLVPTGWSAAADTATGLEAVTIACFCCGTRIATPAGAVPIEQLQIGDHVRTASGETRPILWIGRAFYRRPFGDREADLNPIRITAGAIAEGHPARDLYLSPEHGVLFDGVLIPARRLVNGTTIRQIQVDTVAYYHIELPSHDVVLAENIPCESYLDTGNRDAFASRATATNPPAHDTNTAIREAASHSPLRITGKIVTEVDARLNARALALGYSAAKPKSPTPRRSRSIDRARLLQPSWYLTTYPDVGASGMDAAQHYARWGQHEGRLPCDEIDLIRRLGLVDPGTVAVTMADIVHAGQDPVTHFCTTGWRERRQPIPYFDTAWYRATHHVPDGMNPLLHYVLSGERLGLPPGPHFDPAWYRRHYGLTPSVLAIAHYLRHRRTQRFSPRPGFDLTTYRQVHKILPGRDPYAHYEARSFLKKITKKLLSVWSASVG